MRKQHAFHPEPLNALEARWVPGHGFAFSVLALRLRITHQVHTSASNHPLPHARAVRLPMRGILAALAARPQTVRVALPVQITTTDPPPISGTAGVLTPPQYMNCIDMNPDMLDPNGVCAPG